MLRFVDRCDWCFFSSPRAVIALAKIGVFQPVRRLWSWLRLAFFISPRAGEMQLGSERNFVLVWCNAGC